MGFPQLQALLQQENPQQFQIQKKQIEPQFHVQHQQQNEVQEFHAPHKKQSEVPQNLQHASTQPIQGP